MFKLKYFWPYILFFCTIVLLVVANRISIRNEVARNLAYAKTINVSGKQRMYSQKLAKLSLLKVIGEDVNDDMNASLDVWKTTHEGMTNGSPNIPLYVERHPEIAAMVNDTKPVFDQLYNDYSTLASSNATIDSTLLSNILKNEEEYLNRMDKIVLQLESNARLDLEHSREKQSLLAVISGILLVLEMAIFVYPYHKRLVNAYRKVKRQQDELEHQKGVIEHLYETNELIIKGTNAGMWEWDVITGDENWSDRFFHILGYERGDIKPCYDTFLNTLLHPDDKQKIVAAVDLHLKNGTPYKHEIRMLNKNGEYRWYETAGQAYWGEDGEPLRMAGSIIDVTTRVSTREKLLSESNTKDKLLSIIAHDLRSPLINLRGLLELLREHVISKEEFTEHLNTVEKNINSMSDSMDSMLNWAQSQLKGWEVNASDILIDDAILECTRLYNATLEKKDIELMYEPTKLLKGYADFNQVVLIIRNILNNAIKFTPANGKISIDIVDEAEYVTVVIKDSGKGMDSDTIDKVMSKGISYTTKGTNGEKGTGLGMSMCIDFAEKNNCKLHIDSTPGEGTAVYLSIPKAA